MAADKKTGRDASGINKKVKDAHKWAGTASGPRSGTEGMSKEKSRQVTKSVLDQAWTMKLMEKFNTPASDGTGTKRIGGKK